MGEEPIGAKAAAIYILRDYKDDKEDTLLNEVGINSPTGGLMERHRYPRTPHVPTSPGATKDDKIIKDMSYFVGQRVVITKKMDGECTTIYPDGYIHARSLEKPLKDESYSWIKRIAVGFCKYIPPYMRLCGENLYWEHRLYYPKTPFFLAFGMISTEGVGEDKGYCESWRFVENFCEQCGIPTVPVLFRGIFDEELLTRQWVDTQKDEGWVIRLEDSFPVVDFDKSVAKWVRENHVPAGTSHWKSQKKTRNGMG